jgi:hypothetical protein
VSVRCTKGWKACSVSGRGPRVFHGSGDPADWEENDDPAPWWSHADNWHDIREAVNAGLPVFTADTGWRVTDMLELSMAKGYTDARQVLIPQRFYETIEQQAIDSILSHQQ